MKTFTPSSKNILLFIMTSLNWVTPGQEHPAACNYLEFLLWCNEAASSR